MSSMCLSTHRYTLKPKGGMATVYNLGLRMDKNEILKRSLPIILSLLTWTLR